MSDTMKPALPPADPATGKPLAAKEQPGYYPGFSTLSQKAYWDAVTRGVVLKRLEAPGPMRFFTPAEAVTLQAVTGRIIPQEDRTPERRIPILPGIDKRLAEDRLDGFRYEDMPPDQEVYRIAARAFEQTAQALHRRAFHELGIREQEEIVQAIHDKKPLAAQKLWAKMNLERFWTLLVTDCSAVYYAHPWSWDEIGFGGPAYPRGYMRLEEGEAEPWERDEQRYAWAAPADTISDTLADAKQQQGSAGQKDKH